MVAMPNLINLPKRQASLLIESSGLKIGQLKYKPDLSIEVVIGQEFNGRNIREGDSIQKGSVIDMVLGKGLSNQRTFVPNLSGMKLDPAKNRILESSLNLGTFVYDNTIKKNADSINAFVYKQNPEYNPNATLQLGSSIYLWLTVDPEKLHLNQVEEDTVPPVITPDSQSN
jgi:beta-lactam-binding protein with PASTA domain